MLRVEPQRGGPFETPYSSREGAESRLGGLVLTAAVAASTFVVALDGGGYALTSRHAVAVCLLWLLALGVGLGFWPRARQPASALVVGGLLAAFALWTGLSLLWSPSVEKSFAELDRVVLYVALFAVVQLSASWPSQAASSPTPSRERRRSASHSSTRPPPAGSTIRFSTGTGWRP